MRYFNQVIPYQKEKNNNTNALLCFNKKKLIDTCFY